MTSRLRYPALVAVLALSALLNLNRLSQNGYANIFYSAGVRSMLRSLHNFVFVSSDPGGLITVDKPPLALWVQAASAKVFGFTPLSLLLPEAIAGVLAVALLYRLLVTRFGVFAALAAALSLAVFPSFVAVSRDNGVDPILILLMILAAGAALRACETGRWRSLLWCAALVGLAFNTKTLAAYLVVPGIALAYLLCAPGSLPRRAGQLLTAGVLMVVISFSWIAFVELTPASQRPWVGSSNNNSELGLTFEYNGVGRVGGQVGGPGQVPVGYGALVALPLPLPLPGAHPRHHRGSPRTARPALVPPPNSQPTSPPPREGRERNPIPFGGPPGPLRLLGVGLGDQGGWMLPFALFGLLAALALVLLDSRRGARLASARRDPRLAAIMVLGGWFLVEAAVLSLSKGIVHPYYISALAPGTAAMSGAGAGAFVELSRRRPRNWLPILAPCAVAATVAVQIVLLQREHYMHWFVPVLGCGAALGIAAVLLWRGPAKGAMALTLGLLLIAPTAYASTTWLAPVEGTFPAAGPKQASGAGGVGLDPGDLRRTRSLIRYVDSHGPGSRWALLTDAATTAAPFILLGMNAGSISGYSGTDPVLDGAGVARLVARGEARYVLLGGEFSSRGGNRGTLAVLRACRVVPGPLWQGRGTSLDGLTLFDCSGRERALSAS